MPDEPHPLVELPGSERAPLAEATPAGELDTSERAELTLEIMGHQGLGWSGEPFGKDEIAAVRSWLGGKAMSIYGGSAEIQNNIVSKRILGLPDTTQST